jgi:uncharacterized membrane protein
MSVSVLLLTFLLYCDRAWSLYQLEYTIDVHADGSATWTIEHSFPDGEDALFRQLSDYRYFSETFIENVKSLVNLTRKKVDRTGNMTVETFVMKVVEAPYDIVQYRFYWRGFAEIDGTRIRIGDVFEVEGLFLQGDGKVNILYPSDYEIETVSPPPDEESSQRLTWYGTARFETGEPKIVLKEKTVFGFMEISKDVFFVSLMAFVGIGFISLYYYFFKLRKRKPTSARAPFPSEVPKIEDDEEKIISLLEAAGGSLWQSTLVHQCGFSRSKTSKLLKAMENDGKIRRKATGREKMVMLIKQPEEFEETKRKERAQP